MRRILNLFREWLEIRARVREERRFHLGQAETDWLALGLSQREASRAARRRFGAGQSRRAALRELGGDVGGLARLFHAHQVRASAWIQPAVLIAGVALLVFAGPDSRAVFEGTAVRPATALWMCIDLFALLVLTARVFKTRWVWPWFLYGLFHLALCSFISIVIWALVMQAWSRVAWRTDGIAVFAFVGVLLAYVGVVAIQCGCWWRDLHRRCPICLEGLRLPLVRGSADRVLLSSIVTESVCIHGHGVLVENRWSRHFRPSASPLEWLFRA